MDPAHKQVLDLIKEHGGEQVRGRKHIIYRFPNGRSFTIAKTPSDNRGWLNCLSDLRRVLEIQRTFRPNWGERREKVLKKEEEAAAPVELSTGGLHFPSLQEKLGVAMGTRMSHEDLMKALNKVPDREKYKPPRIHHTPRPRHGEVKSIPPEILNESRYLSKVWGAEAGEKYLQDYIDTHWYGQKKKEENNKEETTMSNPANVLEEMVNNARTNLQKLEDEIKQHEAALKMKNDGVKALTDFLATLELTAEAAKSAAPALRGILPVETRSFGKLAGKRGYNPTKRNTIKGENEAALRFAYEQYATQEFSVADLWRKIENHPDLSIRRTALYSVLNSAALDKQGRDALLQKLDAGRYRFKARAFSSTEADNSVEATA